MFLVNIPLWDRSMNRSTSQVFFVVKGILASISVGMTRWECDKRRQVQFFFSRFKHTKPTNLAGRVSSWYYHSRKCFEMWDVHQRMEVRGSPSWPWQHQFLRTSQQKFSGSEGTRPGWVWGTKHQRDQGSFRLDTMLNRRKWWYSASARRVCDCWTVEPAKKRRFINRTRYSADTGRQR